MENIIEIKNLNKSYGSQQAITNLSFVVKEGELFSFLGVNGAGKSTTINIICGVLSKDNGTVIVNGHNIDDNLNLIKSDIGVVFQNSYLDQELTVKDNLKLKASLYGIYGKEFNEKVKVLSKMLDFEDYINKSVKKLSGGQKRRIDIARALIHSPKILILDEPTTGLDPQTRKLLWNVISTLRKQKNMTVILTTHYMEEASESDYIVIIDKGVVSARGTPLELKNKYTNDSITLYNINEDKVKDLGYDYQVLKNSIRLSIKTPKDATELIIKHPDIFIDYEISKGKMDEIFLSVTGKNLMEISNNENA